jgi:hypothetical protein
MTTWDKAVPNACFHGFRNLVAKAFKKEIDALYEEFEAAGGATAKL